MISFSKFNLENKDILLCSQVSNFGLGLVQVLIAEKDDKCTAASLNVNWVDHSQVNRASQGIILVYIPSPPILPLYMELCGKWG